MPTHGSTTGSENVARARFRVITGQEGEGALLDVHFNPDSLEYTVTNNINRQGRGNARKQYVSQSSGTLSMDLVFDTTHSGEDVRALTGQIKRMMRPESEGGSRRNIAQLVQFEWGGYRFRGVLERFKETIDFFSSEGIPLRASLSISMAEQPELFADEERSMDSGQDGGAPQQIELSPGETQRARRDPALARELARQNNQESLRGPVSDVLTFDPSAALRPAVGFRAAGGGTLGLQAGGGVTIAGGIGVELGVGLDLGIQVGAGMGAGASLGFGVDLGMGVHVGMALNVDATATGRAGGVRGQGATSVPTAASGSTAGSGAASTGGAAGALNTGLLDSGGQSVEDEPVHRAAHVGTTGQAAPTPATATAPTSSRSDMLAFGATNGDDEEKREMRPRFGSNASAGVPAVLGAFAGLRPPPPPRLSRLFRGNDLIEGERDARLRLDDNTHFALGGRVVPLSASGLRADVGHRADLRNRIAFDGE